MREVLPIPTMMERPKSMEVIPIVSIGSQLVGVEVEDYKIRSNKWNERKNKIDEFKRMIRAVQNKSWAQS